LIWLQSCSQRKYCVDEEDLAETINKIGYPIVLNHLTETTVKGLLMSLIGKMLFWFGFRQRIQRVIVKKFITGFDFRILVIDNKLAAAKRVPAHVIGNGENSIQELIATENLDPKRGYGHENVQPRSMLTGY
jgi:cyanophycin synthetase